MTIYQRIKTILYYPLLFPHLMVFMFSNIKTKGLIQDDIKMMQKKNGFSGQSIYSGLLFFLAFYKSFRNLFYYRIGRWSKALSWYIRPYALFFIQAGDVGGGCYVLNHPYGTILHAKSIGSNFNFCHLTTIGQGVHGDPESLPIIGNNVSLGANVTIIGRIRIGNNVTIGGGSIVVHDIPDNCVAVGNPAKVIKSI